MTVLVDCNNCGGVYDLDYLENMNLPLCKKCGSVICECGYCADCKKIRLIKKHGLIKKKAMVDNKA